MNIGIIGVGEMGGCLTRQYRNAGHNVKISNSSGAGTLQRLAKETGASAVKLEQVVRDVDVVVISIPLGGVLKLPPGLFDSAAVNTAIVDTSNYYPIRDGAIVDIEAGMAESVWVSRQIQRPIVKAYNSILYRSLVNSGLPKGTSSRLALPLAGDNKVSTKMIASLIEDSGFDALDYGSLQDSWRQQPGSPAYCTDLTLQQLSRSLSKARRELLPKRRELGLEYILSHNPELWMDNVMYNREIFESDLTER